MGGFLLIGLAGFGITGVLTSIGTSTVARVGDRDISTLDFQRAYNQQINAAAQQIGSMPTAEQALSLGIPSNVLNQLATDQVLNMLSDQFGLGISDQRLTELLQKDPNFAGAIGKFSRMVFDRVLRQNGYTDTDFFKSRRQAAKRQQIALGVFAQTRTPETVLRLMQRFSEDRRTIEYFVVSPDSLLPIAAPSDTVLETYLKRNQSQYRTEEVRNIKIIELSPQIIAQTYTVSDAEIKAEYERTKDRLVKPERRTVEQVVLPDAATVKIFEDGLNNGVSYDDLVKQAGLSSTKAGTLAENEIANLNLAQNTFDLKLGEFAIINTGNGKLAITVTAIDPGGQIPLADVADQIAEKLKMDKARPAYNDMLDKIEEQRAAFVDMDKIAAQFNLKVNELAIKAKGTKLVETLGLTDQQASKVATTIFNSEAGKLAPSVPLGANKTIWFDLVSVDPARDQSLDEVRQKLTDAWIAVQKAAALKEKADAMLAQLNDGQPLADIAVANGLFPQTAAAVSRSGDGTKVIDDKVASAAFGGGVGYTGAVQNGQGNYVVFKVEKIEEATKPLNAKSTDFIKNGYRDDIYAGFANSLRQDAPLRINQQVLNQLLGLNTGQ
ncbi:hypothetical protein MNBD_ALPHA12-818 [hydrothermal vent metagenome]|uniref:PpiC domain-containing protein n=1 Tax=hydrothermal vent metagenome TaxID=652676 RepID=A0A3B0U1T1_9ZZZZ